MLGRPVGGTEDYSGSEPLDPALADRFALFVTAADWDDLTRRAPAASSRRRARDGHRRRTASCARHCKIGEIDSAGWRTLPGAGHDVRHDGRQRAQRRGRAHLAAPRAAARAQPPRRRRSSRTAATSSGCSAACSSAACRTRPGAQPVEPRRSPRRTGPRGTRPVTKAAAWIHAFLTEPRARPQARAAARRAAPTRTTARRRSRSASPPRRRSARRRSRSPSTRRRALGSCRSAPRASTTSPRSPRRSWRSTARSAWQERLSEQGTSHPEFARIAKALAPLDGGRLRARPAVPRWCLVEGIQSRRPASSRSSSRRASSCSRERGLAWSAVMMLRGRASGMWANTGGPMSRTPQGAHARDPAGQRRPCRCAAAHGPGRGSHFPDARPGRRRARGTWRARATPSAGDCCGEPIRRPGHAAAGACRARRALGRAGRRAPRRLGARARAGARPVHRASYDPARPVLWTQACLTRRLELFDPAGFYA